LCKEFQFGEFTLDLSRYQLKRGDRTLRLEKRPMDLLIRLVERRGELVSREEIAEHLWGKDVFLEVDHGINTAIRKIRQALRDDPSKPRYIETVVGKGYRFAAPVVCENGGSDQQVEGASTPNQILAEPVAPSTESPRTSARMWQAIGVSAVLALVAVTGFWYRGRGAKPAIQPTVRSIAVLPLKNMSGNPTEEYLADGMTEELIGRLSRIRDLKVISRTSVMGFKDTKLPLPQIAKRLGVDALVEGSIIRLGNRIRVHAQLIRGSTDEHLWADEYDGELGDVLTLESEVAQSIAQRVEVKLTGEELARLVTAHHVSPEVYQSYLKAEGQFNKSSSQAELEQSIAYFEETIGKDANFAPAYVGIASAYERLGSVLGAAPPKETHPKMMSAARKAIELDPDLAEPHVLLAGVYQKQWQWSNAEAEFKRALELNSNDAGAHVGYAKWLLCQGRTDEALVWVQRARELDPLGGAGSTPLGGVAITNGFILFHARRYDEAIRELRNDDPDHWILGLALIANGQPGQAISVLENALGPDRNPAIMGVLVRAYAHAGRRREALRLVDELKRRQQTSYVAAAPFVHAYLGLGDNEQALAWLERAYKEQSNILQLLKVHPYFDPLRGDPRFTDLVHRVGLDKPR